MVARAKSINFLPTFSRCNLRALTQSFLYAWSAKQCCIPTVNARIFSIRSDQQFSSRLHIVIWNKYNNSNQSALFSFAHITYRCRQRRADSTCRVPLDCSILYGARYIFPERTNSELGHYLQFANMQPAAHTRLTPKSCAQHIRRHTHMTL